MLRVCLTVRGISTGVVTYYAFPCQPTRARPSRAASQSSSLIHLQLCRPKSTHSNPTVNKSMAQIQSTPSMPSPFTPCTSSSWSPGVISRVCVLAYRGTFATSYNTFATGGGDAVVSVWDMQAKKRLRQFPKYSASISSLAFNSDGNKLAIAAAVSPEEGSGTGGRNGLYVRWVGEDVKVCFSLVCLPLTCLSLRIVPLVNDSPRRRDGCTDSLSWCCNGIKIKGDKLQLSPDDGTRENGAAIAWNRRRRKLKVKPTPAMVPSPLRSTRTKSVASMPPTSPTSATGPPSTSSSTDLVLSTPTPVLLLITHGAPLIRSGLFFARLVTWTHPNPFAPWLLVALWIALSLGARAAALWAFPALGLLVLSLGWISRRTKRCRRTTKPASTATATIPTSPTATPAEFDALLTDSSILASHVRDLSNAATPLVNVVTWQDPPTSVAAMSFLLTSYPFYLALTYFVRLRYIVLGVGLVALTWLAPWSVALRRLLWRSAVVRLVVRFVVGVLGGGKGLRREWAKGRYGVSLIRQLASSDDHADGGRGRPPPTSSDKGVSEAASAEGRSRGGRGGDESGANNVHFVFTVFENQRWWVGLDWTQALLPNERPSW
jgi:hypothetical protein